MINAKRIASCMLTAAMVVAAPAWAQETKADQERALRDAERQMRDAERQMREAERQMREAARKMAEMQVDKVRHMYEKRVAVYGDNARLGIVLRSERDPKTDAIGAVVQALTPGGPAEESGLQAGDIIMRFNGEALGLPAGAQSEETPGPTDRLMERAATLKEGDQVTLEVKRGDTTKTLTVTARKLYGSRVKVFTVPEVPEIPDIHVDVEPFEVEFAEQFEAGAPVAWTAFTSDLKGIEMVTLNPELGEYFGAKEGILVVKAPADSPFQLKAGDVILKIGDREPTSPAQAMRVLRSYAPTETVSIEVMRNRARTTVTASIPEPKGHSVRYHAAPVVPPVPPPPPAPPAPPAHSSL